MQPGKERELGLRVLSHEFRARGILDGIFTPVNGEFELLGKFGRCFIVRVVRLRSSSNSSSNRGLSSSIGNRFLLNFGGSI
jgi:hypothetical protein